MTVRLVVPAVVATILTRLARCSRQGLSAADVPDLATSAATTSRDRLRLLRQRAETQVVPLMWRHQRAWIEEIFAAVESVSFAHSPCLIHGDLAPYHVLHDPQSGRLTGVLDFGVAGLGDPAVDLGCLLAGWGEKYTAELDSDLARRRWARRPCAPRRTDVATGMGRHRCRDRRRRHGRGAPRPPRTRYRSDRQFVRSTRMTTASGWPWHCALISEWDGTVAVCPGTAPST